MEERRCEASAMERSERGGVNDALEIHPTPTPRWRSVSTLPLQGRVEANSAHGLSQHRVHYAATTQASACSSNASHMRRALTMLSCVSTSAVAPQATGSRASSSAC